LQEINIAGRLKVPAELQGSEFKISRVRVQQNSGIEDGLNIAIGVTETEKNGTLAAIFLDISSAQQLANALLAVIKSSPT
jgi:hypothetical protein